MLINQFDVHTIFFALLFCCSVVLDLLFSKVGNDYMCHVFMQGAGDDLNATRDDLSRALMV